MANVILWEFKTGRVVSDIQLANAVKYMSDNRAFLVNFAPGR